MGCDRSTIIPSREASWYAVSTRSRQERVVAAMLDSIGVPYFLPLVTEVHRWSDRKQTVVVPLFACYLFVRIPSPNEVRLRILQIPGVVDLVGNQGGPLSIPDEEIESVRAVLAQGIECCPYPFLATGDRVRIVRGALAGIEGTFLRSGPESRLVISIEMIRQSVAIHVDGCDIEPVDRERCSYLPAAQTALSA